MTPARAQGQRALWGAGATATMAVMAAIIWGRSAVMGAAILGGVATGVQLLVARMMIRTGASGAVDHVKVYATGVLFRLFGVVILAALVSADRLTFPPLASALGYLGTVLPLMYLETRLSR